MTLKLMSGVSAYAGVAADSKPTAGVAAGSQFYELDTNKYYLYDGAAWQAYNAALSATELHLGEVGGRSAFPSSNFTRPANTTAYASGQLIANSTTAASVVALSWAASRISGGSGLLRRVRLIKSGLSVTLATFRLHLYGADPSLSSGIANGDGAAWSTNRSSYLGAFELDMTAAAARVFRDSAEIIGVPAIGSEINFTPDVGSTIYGLLEARAAYVPASAEVFTVELEILQN